MRVAFVGVKKDWDALRAEGYLESFIKYHLELPWYYAKFGANAVDIYTENSFDEDNAIYVFGTGGSYTLIDGTKKFPEGYDVVIHWRKWFSDFYDPNAINVINSQDHSYSSEWMSNVFRADEGGKLHGIMCFPTWHEENLRGELPGLRLISGLTLGVDTDIYKPTEKDPFSLLWASDPGRGLWGVIPVINDLYRRDQRYKLHVCWPDYVSNSGMYESLKMHPAIVFHKNLKNGPELWNLFNTSAFLPYTSQFKEPSSRAHRQAQAAGQFVFYPPDMGSPSYLIDHSTTGWVCSPDSWSSIIDRTVTNWDDYKIQSMSKRARQLAINENWEVQARRFNKYFQGLR